MRSRLLSFTLLTIVIGIMICLPMTGGPAAADSNSDLFWDKPDTIKVASKPKDKRKRTGMRTQATAKGEEVAPLLTLRYQVLKRGDGNSMDRVNPNQEFAIGDQVKLSITPNQDGFLYVVHNSVDTAGNIIDKPHVVFPDPKINNGENRVKKNERYVVPGYCQDFSDPNDCWWEITPPNGKENFTVIFSRDEITNLTNRITIDELETTGANINEQLLAELKSESSQKVERTDKIRFTSRRNTESEGVYVQNTNRKDNEELIETITLNHQTGDDENPVARTRALYTKKRTNGMRIILLKDGTEVDPSREFKSGDEIKVRFQSNFTGFVYIVNVTPGGKKCLLFPCSRTMVNAVRPTQWYALPTGDYVIAFDEEKGTEVLQVIMSRERIGFLDAAVNECCDLSKCCEVSAAAELMANTTSSQQSGIAQSNVRAIAPQTGAPGIRARSIILASGKDKNKETSYVAVQGGELQNKELAVFEIRLKHN